MSFGKLVKEYRLRRDMSLRDLASKAGLDHSYISRLEREMGPNPSRKTVMLIAAALNAPADELLEAAGYLPEPIRKEDDGFLGAASRRTNRPDGLPRVLTEEEIKVLERIVEKYRHQQS